MNRLTLDYLAAQWQQTGDRPTPPPVVRLFVLNTPPKQPNTRYVWQDDAAWDDTLTWIE